MQEQVNDKSVQLIIKGTKLTGHLLAKAMGDMLEKRRQKSLKPKKGSQSMKKLSRTSGGADTPSIEVKGRIRSFQAIAREFDVGYHIEKDPTTKPTTWTVYFHANKTGAVTAAFKKYTKLMLGRDADKPSMLANLHEKILEVGRNTIGRARHKELELSR